MLYCGTTRGEHTDKFKESGLTKEDCEKIDCCRIREAAAYLECEVVDEITTGDHSIFVGRVLKSDILNNEKRIFQFGDINEFTTTVD